MTLYLQATLFINIVSIEVLSHLTARHAACKKNSNRRAGLVRAKFQGRQTATKRQTGYMASFERVPSVPARTPPLRPSPPNNRGQGLAVPQRATLCQVSPPPDAP